MAYIDFTDPTTLCILHEAVKCWDCLAAHHVEETTMLVNKIAAQDLEIKKVVREACGYEE